MLDIQHQPPVHPPRPADLVDAGQRRQLQQLADRRARRHLPGRQNLGRRHPALFADHRMEVTADQRVVGQPLGGDEPAAALLTVDQALRLQLDQRLAQGDPGRREQLAELALGRQLATRRQQTMADLLAERPADRRYGG